MNFVFKIHHMKHLLLLTITLTTLIANAQFDERFYYPKKEWTNIPDSVEYQEQSLKVNGHKISILVLAPQAKKRETILFFHGAGGNVSTYLPMTVPLSKHGFEVIMVDVRGYGKSEGKPTHLGIAEDAPLILEELQNKKAYKNQQFILYGASMGTQVATHLCSLKNEAFKLLVLDGPMSSFTDIALFSAPEEQKQVIQQFVTSPYSAKEDIKGVRIPVLIVHSEDDSAVPKSQGKLIYEHANAPKFFWEYHGEHLEAAQKQAEELSRRMMEAID